MLLKSSRYDQSIEPLTPYHFWLHRRSPVVPLGEYSRPNFQDRFKRTQHLANVVWQQWVKLYLPSLISRKKWRNEERNISVNDVVLVADLGVLHGKWKFGRVVNTYSGKDGRVRAGKVTTTPDQLQSYALSKRTGQWLRSSPR